LGQNLPAIVRKLENMIEGCIYAAVIKRADRLSGKKIASIVTGRNISYDAFKMLVQ